MSSQSRSAPLFLILFFLWGCAWAPRTPEYRNTYEHLSQVPRGEMTPGDYQLVLLVCARHLDYSHSQNLLKTMVKHPQDGSLGGDVGHVWILLKGEGEVLEGGHSGELGLQEPKYFDGVMNLVESGDPNPVRYMHKTLSDGYFEGGAGGFPATYAIKIDLNINQYRDIRRFVKDYDYRLYSLTNRQCVSFALEAARMAGIELKSQVTVPVGQYIRWGNQQVRVWTNPKYQHLTLMSPDVLEKSMMEAVYQGKAEYALDWYHNNYEQPQGCFEWRLLFERLCKIYLL